MSARNPVIERRTLPLILCIAGDEAEVSCEVSFIRIPEMAGTMIDPPMHAHIEILACRVNDIAIDFMLSDKMKASIAGEVE